MNDQRALCVPPRAKQIGLGVDSEYGRKTGLYGWFVTSNRTWDILPKRHEKIRLLDNLHLLLTFSSSILNRLLIGGGCIKTVNVRENNVPMVAAPSRL